MVNCCLKNLDNLKKYKECLRDDGKKFSLPRRFSQKKCLKNKVKGFTMKASCAPFNMCKKNKKKTKKNKK